jgi:uncharacterized membrane protein
MAMERFSPEERATIEDAITRAERKTSGEIIVVVATASARYFAYAIMWKHFPPGRIKQNELPNHLIMLDARWTA